MGRRKGQALSHGTGRLGGAPAAEPKGPGLTDLHGAGRLWMEESAAGEKPPA